MKANREKEKRINKEQDKVIKVKGRLKTYNTGNQN